MSNLMEMYYYAHMHSFKKNEKQSQGVLPLHTACPFFVFSQFLNPHCFLSLLDNLSLSLSVCLSGRALLAAGVSGKEEPTTALQHNPVPNPTYISFSIYSHTPLPKKHCPYPACPPNSNLPVLFLQPWLDQGHNQHRHCFTQCLDQNGVFNGRFLCFYVRSYSIMMIS